MTDELKNALEMTGCKDEADLIDMANVGTSLMNAIDTFTTGDDSLIKNWSPADDPAEIVGDLYNMLDESLACHRQAMGEVKELQAALGSQNPTPVSKMGGIDWNNPDDPVVKTFVGFNVEGYVSEYELVGDNAGDDYTPTEHERMLLTDAIYGVVSNIHESLRKLMPASKPANRPTYQQIIELVDQCQERRNAAGESNRMMAKWISEGLNALVSKDSPTSLSVGSEITLREAAQALVEAQKVGQQHVGYRQDLWSALEAAIKAEMQT